jgi:hypothetical protein
MIKVIVAHGAFGRSGDDTQLELMLRDIAIASNPDLTEWADKYGTNFENETFMIHRFCWCEKEDCPWCGGCSCPESAFHYFVDEKEVTSGEWLDYYRRNVPDISNPDWEKISNEVNQHRSERHDCICDYCLGKGIWATCGSEPGKGAPNFWYKSSGFKVWWYKYIGRDMKLNRDIGKEEIEQIKQECLNSLENSVYPKA